MTIPFRIALAALLLAAPLAAHAQHTHAAPAAPAAAPHVAPVPSDAKMLPGDERGTDEMGIDEMGRMDDDAMWLDDADLMAFGLDDELLGGAMFMGADALELGDFEDGALDGPMAMSEDAADAPGEHGMHMAPGGPGGLGHPGMAPGGGAHPGMTGRLGMGGGMGMGMRGGRMGMGGMHGGMGMGPGRMHRGMRGAMHMRMAGLDLTDAQRDKLRALHEANARKAVQRRADLQLAQMDLHKMLRADKPDAGAINTQVDRIAKLRADGVKAAIDTRLQARAVLTPEQWKSLHEPRTGMRAPMMKHGMMDGPESGKQ